MVRALGALVTYLVRCVGVELVPKPRPSRDLALPRTGLRPPSEPHPPRDVNFHTQNHHATDDRTVQNQTVQNQTMQKGSFRRAKEDCLPQANQGFLPQVKQSLLPQAKFLMYLQQVESS